VGNLVSHIKKQEQNEVFEKRLLKKVFERKREKKMTSLERNLYREAS